MNIRRERGFTLLDAITVTILISIGSAIMLPNLAGLLDRAQADKQKELLAAHLQSARAHAVTHATAVEVCGSSDGLQCDGSWKHGWLARDQQSAHVLVGHRNDRSGLEWKGFSSEIVYLPNGTTPRSNGRFEICSPNGEPLWSLVLNRQGRLRQEKVTQNTERNPCQTGYP